MAFLAQRYGEPAAWLTAAATVWAIVNPSSYKVVECIAALIPVLAGYNQTARQCEKGLIVDQEGAWYGVHRWAARRTAHLLTKLSADNPPLGQVIDVWEGLDIRVGSSRINSNSNSGWATAAAMKYSNGGSEFWGSISLGGGGGGNKGGNKKRNIAKATTGSIETEKLNGEAHSASVASTPLKTGKSLSSSLPSSSSGGTGTGVHHHRLSSGNLMDSPADWSSSPRTSSCVDNSSEDGLAVGTTSNNNNNVVRNSDKDDDGTCWLDDEETSAALAEVTAALYGRADHLLGDEDDEEGAASDQNVGIGKNLRLTVRGIHLVALFAPFIVFGTVLLLAASSIAARRQQRLERKGIVTGGKESSKEDGSSSTIARATTNPPSSSSVPIDARMRSAAFKLLLWACRQSGAAFIKWGQWASTREDIFPDDFCRILSNLHDQAPEHSYQQSRSIIEQSFNGKTIEDMFVWFDPVPLASGSIAQVHKAGLRMSVVDGRPLPPSYNDDDDDNGDRGGGEESVVHTVAVKVRHPGVAQRIWEDFQVLRPFAAMTSRVRTLKGLGLKDTVSQFSHTMTAQADLRVEAAHLTRFYNNFKSLSSRVVVPKPIRGMTREAVLVETFEPGLSVAKFIRQPAPCNTKIVSIGVDTYLKMLLSDNFVHTDLHPGNILVRPAIIDAGKTSVDAGSNNKKKKSIEDIMMKDGDEGPVQVILLDFGLAEELTPRVRRHFIGFLNAISAGDGPTAAGHLLNWATRQKCPDPAALITDVEELFKKDCNIHQPGGIDLDRVMKSILHLARKHEVSIDSGYAALVVGVCVIVGFATGLDPRVNLMDAATPCMLYYNLTGRVAGRLYS
jgi:aarF domain-containing kinase